MKLYFYKYSSLYNNNIKHLLISLFDEYCCNQHLLLLLQFYNLFSHEYLMDPDYYCVFNNKKLLIRFRYNKKILNIYCRGNKLPNDYILSEENRYFIISLLSQ